MDRKLDLIGQKFGRLTVIGKAKSKDHKHSYWLCKCSCGKQKIVRADSLKAGHTLSCGCYQKEIAAQKARKEHPYSKTITYLTWHHMKQRCLNKTDQAYPYYGGRGIKICKRWENNFENFLQDMGEKPEGLTIERIDNNGDYEPENCKWATYEEQSNNRRSNKIIEHNGKKQNIKQWSKELGIEYGTLHCRFYRGWSAERALTTPVKN